MEDVPDWVRAALADAPVRDDAALEVDGVPLSTWTWAGAPGAPRLVLVHGGGAHNGWWSWTAPFLAPAFEVVALELSGHGRSGRRPGAYRFGTWADEALAAAGAGPAVLVGHSMGGVVVGIAAARAGAARIPAVVLVDAPLERPVAGAIGHGPRRMARSRPAPTREELLARFRLLPDQPALHPALERHAAEEGVVAHPEGFAWRFDPTVFDTAEVDRPARVDDLLATYAGHVGGVVAEHSEVLPAAHRGRLESLCAPEDASGPSTFVEVPDAHHQIMFDHPLELLAALDGMFARWGLPRVRLPGGASGAPGVSGGC